MSDDEQFVSFDIKDMYPPLPEYDVLSEIRNRINDNKFSTSIDKGVLIELAILSLEFMSFTTDQKYCNQNHWCTNLTMFRRNLYSKGGRKSCLYNLKRSSSLVQKS